MSDDWFRCTDWNGTTQAEFEVRLGGARDWNRPQYLRIQGVTLLGSSSADDRAAGRALLRRMIAEYPDDWEVAGAWESLGTSHAADGAYDEARTALRACIDACRTSSTGVSGTSGVPELSLAEVLIADGTDLDEAARLLAAVEAKVLEAAFIASIPFRFLAACARLADRTKNPDAGSFANRALEIAETGTRPLPRHPGLATVAVSQGTRDELTAIAARHPENGAVDASTAFGASSEPIIAEQSGLDRARRTEAVPGLIATLTMEDRPDSERATIPAHLTFRSRFWPDMVGALHELSDERSPLTRDALAQMLAFDAGPGQLDQVLEILRDRSYGSCRAHFLQTLTRVRHPDRWAVVEQLRGDPDLRAPAERMLANKRRREQGHR